MEQDVSANDLTVLFLSSPSRKTPILQQKSSPHPDSPVLWDYHVILLMRNKGASWIFDFDSHLSFPVQAGDYFQKCFYPQDTLSPEHQVYIREISADEYLKTFTSDRSHMLDSEEKPLVRFPPYPPINQNKEETISLMEYLDIEKMQLKA
ncbi:protein N-terminal glutamine amidohydrolase [Sansalvadorimonas sp. 2012CJ34-2]|uniref:Protein N-terminal glutamine amidohydrolase n=1 Tax=Parendozoicomonas callyspongiae TaxID=2942213 RepID=A0ABT0PGW3_9GAMM|nr:protein N-terminal glutamine amidohydrolase [Sansalvadorimonas sp. 2012CJ34-2]